MTAAIAMYRCQELPPPWSARTSTAKPFPFIVYGASSSLGCFAIKLAKASNIHPIIAIAGGSHEYVSKLIDPTKGVSSEFLLRA
jgi:NADPH2:quinone reductase